MHIQRFVVDSLGNGTFFEFRSDGEDAGVEPVTFQLSREDLDWIWFSLDVTNYFDLEPLHVADDANGRDFTEMVITGNGVTHRVVTRNLYVVTVDLFFQELQKRLPDGLNLHFTSYIAPYIDPLDPCVFKTTFQKTGSFLHTPATEASSTEGSSLYVLPADLGDLDHAGTVIYRPTTLPDLVQKQKANILAKGGYAGDIVQLIVDNTEVEPTADVNATLYLDLYGSGATPENCQSVEDRIESDWTRENVFVGDGQPRINFRTEVVANCRENQFFAPRTPGYHQIELLDKAHREHRSFVSHIVDVNEDVASGTWATKGDVIEGVYSHEAGHLFGLEDEYDDWNKTLTGNWENNRTGEVLSTEDLARLQKEVKLDPRSVPEIAATLQPLPVRLIGLPRTKDVKENLMATPKGVLTDDIFVNLARKAGLLITIEPGQLLMPRENEYQNIVTTRYQQIFVGPGVKRTINGIWGKCTEAGDKPPIAGLQLDLGPSLGALDNYPLARATHAFVDSMATQNLYCTFGALYGLWRLTDNHFPDSTAVTDFLRNYGVDVGNEFLDFPDFTNPGSSNSISKQITPPEVYAIDISSTESVIQPGESIALEWSMRAPSGYPVPSIQHTWNARTTSGESLVFNEGGQSAQAVADQPGLIEVDLDLSLLFDTNEDLQNTVSLPFSVKGPAIETFELDALDQSAFTWTHDERHPWFLTDWTSHTGAKALRSGVVRTGGGGMFEPVDTSSIYLGDGLR